MDIKSIGLYVGSVVIGSIGASTGSVLLIWAGVFAGLTTGVYNCVKMYEKFSPVLKILIKKHLKK